MFTSNRYLTRRVAGNRPIGLNAWRQLGLCLAFVAALAFGSLPGKAEQKTVLALGDSLTAGFGLDAGESFPDQLEDWLVDQGLDVKVINAGVSGDTSSGGRSRLAWVLGGLSTKPDLVIVELGGNDVLRNIPPDITARNIDAIVDQLTDQGIDVLLAGMLASPNLGPEYEAAFNRLYSDVAEKYGARLYPFFLDGVATRPDLHQDDGIHPTAEGVGVIVDRIGPDVAAALDKAES